MTMHQQKVTVHVEIPQPIGESSMEIEDMIRCLGILLDNAMEAVVDHESARVVLVLLDEPEKLSVIVKNDLYTDIEMSRIYQEGYSTKGTNRGLGLASMQQIIRKYENVVQETKIEDEQFIINHDHKIASIIHTKYLAPYSDSGRISHTFGQKN